VKVLNLLLSFVILLMFASCISNKKVALLQNRDLNKRNIPKDTVVRTYALDSFTYKIQPNDLISVRFESLTEKEYDFLSANNAAQSSMGLQPGNALLIGELVDESGEIPVPVVGKVKVAGLTIFQIQDKLQKIANEYLESPVVKVRLLNYRITILGEVNKSMLEALGVAGGLGELADRENIKLIRQKGNTTEVLYVNLLDENFMKSPYYYVYQNDVLIVPPLRQRPFRKYFGQNLSLAASTISAIVSTLSIILVTVTLLNE
jgi:polysaccharide biosynthesis/export protein